MRKMKTWQKVLIWVLVALMVLPTVISLAVLVRAENVGGAQASLEEAREEQERRQEQIDAAKQRQEELQVQLDDARSELERLREKQASIFDQKAALDKQANLLSARIDEIDATVAGLGESIESCRAEREALSRRRAALYETFKTRVRVADEEGVVSYLAVLLSADSVSDFLDRIQLVADILRHDRDLMAEIDLLSEAIRVRTASLETEQAEYDGMSAELRADRAELEETIRAAEVLMSVLDNEEHASAELLAEYQRLWDEAFEEEQRLIDEYLAAATQISEAESESASVSAAESAAASRREAESRYLA